MEQVITKEEIEKIRKLKGKARGMAIKGEAEFILHEKGKKGLERLESEMAKLGCPVKYKELKVMGFYPLQYEAFTTLILEKIFNFNDEDFRKAGVFESKISFIVRMFIQYFYSTRKMAEVAPKMWKKYYDIGKLTVPEFNEEKRQAKIKIEGFNHHPCYCRTLEGFIGSLVGMITKTKTSCQETKCIHRGDEYHEYLLRW